MPKYRVMIQSVENRGLLFDLSPKTTGTGARDRGVFDLPEARRQLRAEILDTLHDDVSTLTLDEAEAETDLIKLMLVAPAVQAQPGEKIRIKQTKTSYLDHWIEEVPDHGD